MINETQDILKIPELPVIEIVDDLVQVYKEFMVIRAALKIDLFTWLLENGPATPKQIAEGLGIEPEYMPSLLSMLYYLDMVRKTEDSYYISPAAGLNFIRTSMYYQGDYILHLPNEDSPWQDIETFLTKPDTKGTFDSNSTGSIRALANHDLRGTVQNVTKVLISWPRFSKARTLIEMNGGHGLYAIAACQNNPELRAVVLCGSADAKAAEENIAKFGMNNRISAVSNDILSYQGEKSDIVLLSHSLYPYKERLDEVLKAVASVLNPEGLLLSNHWFRSPASGTGSQGLYELELAIHNRYHLLPDKEIFESICEKNQLGLLQAGITRSSYGQSTIHMAEKKVD